MTDEAEMERSLATGRQTPSPGDAFFELSQEFIGSDFASRLRVVWLRGSMSMATIARIGSRPHRKFF